jgi:hypothetical protein
MNSVVCSLPDRVVVEPQGRISTPSRAGPE